jgi:hypothetical protein
MLQLNSEASALRSQYLQLIADLEVLAAENRDGDALLKDLDDTLFQIRLASQALETLQPLGDTLATIADQTARLEELSGRAFGEFMARALCLYITYWMCIIIFYHYTTDTALSVNVAHVLNLLVDQSIR